MACRGVHFALTKADADRLLAATSDGEVLGILQDEIEERWEEDWLFESDKAWDAIHRCLTNGTLDFSAGSYPLKLGVLGGQQLHSGDDYIVSLVTPAETRDVAVELAKVDKPWLMNRYDAIDANEYAAPKTEDDREYTWAYFQGLTQFFRKAADAGRYVVFSVDQ
jgi:hypothetical protein